MHVGLLECDDVAGRFPRVEGGYREMFAALLEPAISDLRFSHYEAHRGTIPGSPTECDAWVCTGSKYSVYEKREWLGALATFVGRVRQSRVPFVGICFGHQLIAHALGGEVARAAQGWGVGVQEVEILRPEPWMRPPRERLLLHHMHADQVRRLPEGAVVLARSRHCDVEMFCVGESMLGIEGHPEFTAVFAEAVIRDRSDEIGVDLAARALKSLEQPQDGALVGRWIAAFFRAQLSSHMYNPV